MSAHRRRKLKDISVGDRVRSQAVGRRTEFDGVVVEEVQGGWNVKDAMGRVWLRSIRELTLLPKHELSDHQS